MIGFSKWWLIVSALITVVLIVCCIFGVQISDIALAMIAELTTCSGFYVWKAKNENRAKYAQAFVLDFADKYGIDAAIRIAEVVLKD